MRSNTLSLMILATAAAVTASFVLNASPTFADSVDWIGANNGYWDVAGNWNPASPGATDSVLLGGFDTEMRSGSFDILSLTGTGRLTLSGGSLAFAAASSAGTLDMSYGTIDGVGALSIGGASTWTGGNFAYGDVAVVTNSGTFLDQNADNVVNGLYDSGASFVSAGTYTKTGEGTTYFSIGFNNAGTVNVNAGTLALHGGGASGGGVFNVASVRVDSNH